MLDGGMTMAEVAARLGCARSSVSRWRAGTIPAVSRRPRGRPSRLNGPVRYRIVEELSKSPRRRGLAYDQWTPDLARQYVRRAAGYEFTDRTVAVILRGLGFKLLRARHGVPAHWIPCPLPKAASGVDHHRTPDEGRAK